MLLILVIRIAIAVMTFVMKLLFLIQICVQFLLDIFFTCFLVTFGDQNVWSLRVELLQYFIAQQLYTQNLFQDFVFFKEIFLQVVFLQKIPCSGGQLLRLHPVQELSVSRGYLFRLHSFQELPVSG